MPKSIAIAAARVHLRLLGDPALLGADGSIKSLERRAAGLLALVALEPGVTRGRAAALLWPDSDNARQALRQQISRFKKNYAAELVRGEDALFLADGVAVDALADAAAAAGDLLGTLSYEDCADFADWLTQQRQQRRGRTSAQIGQQLAEAEAQGDFAAAVTLAEQLLLSDNDSEAHHRTLMRLHYLRGDIAQAQTVYDRLVRQLAQRFGATPSAETEQLARALRSALVAPRAAAPTQRPVPVTVLRPPRMIGRQRELAALADAWQGGRAALLVGEPGLGKSRLLAEFAADRRVLGVQGRPGDAGVPYATLSRLLRTILERAPVELPAPRRTELARLLPELAPSVPLPADGQRLLLQGAVEAVLAQARVDGERIDGVIVDDLHFADAASVEMLQALVGGDSSSDTAPAAGLRWALAQRPGEGSPAAAALRAALEEAQALDIVPLAPLTVDEMAELIDSLGLPELDSAQLAPQLAKHTGGNPLYALETLKQGLASGLLQQGRLPTPVNVGALIERRLKQLSERALALARVAAIAGVDFSIALAEHVTGVRAVELADAWGELEAAQVLREDSFAHDLVYDAVLRSIPAAVARQLHAQVADQLEAGGGSPERIAQHRVDSGDVQRCVPALRRAAEVALTKFQRPLAAQWLEQAAHMLEGSGRRDEAFALAAQAVQLRQSFDSGPAHEAATRRLLELATTSVQQSEAQTHRAIYLHIVGRSPEALGPVEEALAAARSAADQPSQARALNVRGIVQRQLGRTDEAAAALREALEILRRCDGQDGTDDLPAVLNNLALAELEADDHVSAILHFEESARLQVDAPTRARVLNNLAISLQELGYAERALQTRCGALDLLRGQDGTEFAQLNLLVSLASCARQLQRYGDALAWLAQADALVSAVSHWRVGNLHMERALVFTEMGGWTAAEEAFAALDRSMKTPDPALADALLARAAYQIARRIDARATVAQAEALLSTGGQKRILRRVEVLKLRTLAPAVALPLALAQLQREAAHGNRAAQIPIATLAAHAQLALGSPTEALRLATHAVEAMKAAVPTSVTPFEVRHTLCEALKACGDHAGAAAQIKQLAADLQHVATTQVPVDFRNTYLRGVWLNRRIASEAQLPKRPAPSAVSRR